MLKTRWLGLSLLCSLAVTPTIASAQAKAQAPDTTKKQTENLVRDLIRGLALPNWNLFVNGGATTSERYLVQQAIDPLAGERSLQTATGYNVGGGVGVDVFLHLGLRASYNFSSANMNYRTDNGNGSSALNIDDVARLKANTVTLETMRYMLTSRAPISPYGSLGIQWTWWNLDSKSPLISTAGAGTPVSISPLFSFGVQAKATSHWSGRLEAVLSGGHNPFTGKRAFQSNAGPTIDEPDAVSQTAFRLAAVYHFGRPPKVTAPSTPTMAQH